MKCRSCSAEIAEKAIVCYKCGTPTALPVAPSPAVRARGGVPSWLIAILFVAAAAVAWVAYRADAPASRWMWAAVAVLLGLLGAAGAWRGRNRPGPGLRVH